MAGRRKSGRSAAPARARGAAPGAARPRAASKPATPSARARGAGRAEATALRLPRRPKGKRARFFEDPAVDQLFAIVTSLTAELSVAFERIETLERVLESSGTLDRTRIESWEPDDAEAAQRTAAREALIERVFQVLEHFAGDDAPARD